MLGPMTMRLIAISTVSLTLIAAPAWAATEKIYSYNPADEATRAKVDQGLTFVFDKGLMSMRIKAVMATQANAEAEVEPVEERALGVKLETLLPAGAIERGIYEVQPVKQGASMVRSLCGATTTKGWLVFGALRPRQGAVVHALGDDPATGKARYCGTLNFEFRGEWRLPPNVRAATPLGSRPNWPF